MRRLLTVVVVALTTAALVLAPARAAEPDLSKFSPAMADLYARGGYGTFPIDQVVRGHQPGDVYYLARVEGPIDDAVVEAIRAAGARIRFRFPEIGWVALVSPLGGVAEVSLIPRVTRLELDRIHDIQAISVQATAFADQTRRGTHDVGADVLWAAGITGRDVTIGVTDTGIDSTHPDVGPKLVDFVDCTAVVPTFLTEDAGACQQTAGYDDHGHGTHVAGIAAGAGQGVLPAHLGLLPGMAPGASLAGAKVCLAVGACLNSSVMAGLRYLAADPPEGAGADIVNVSLGSGRFYFSPLFGAEQVTNDDPEAQLVNELARRYNVLFTISAGNSGPVLQSTGSPAVASQSLAVGAAITDFDLDHPVEETLHGEFGNIRPEAAAAGATAIAQFSSRGPTGDRLVKPDLTAPGSYYVAPEATLGAEVKAADAAHNHHFSADPTYAVLSGTSMSAPAAAGAAALVWEGYERATGQDPPYYRLKAALVNTAGTRAFEGPVVGLISGIRAKLIGEDPQALFPLRNDRWVGVTGEGAGRLNAPAALLALTSGVTAYTPVLGELDDIHELQPSWSADDVGPGESAVQTFLLHGAPGLGGKVRVTFSVESGPEALGVSPAPAKWFKLPKGVSVRPDADQPVQLKLDVPATAAPGHYTATVVGSVRLSSTTAQTLRIPVQFFVPVQDPNPADEPAGVGLEGPIWAEDSTDYSAIGFEDPTADIFTDWTTLPLRLACGTTRVDLAVYDVEGADHMDLFVFADNGQEVDSTVTPFLHHAVPEGALYAPTTRDRPARVSILDGTDRQDLTLPTTVWVAVSDSGPDREGFSAYHLDVDVVADPGAPCGNTPPERIHSGVHAWWSGSASGADSHLSQQLALPASATTLRFWTWYNLEDGFDWAYVLVSTDGGATWTSLPTTAPNGSGTTTLDPVGDTGGVLGGNKRYPNGLTGSSGSPPFTFGLFVPQLTEHTVDLSAFAGRTILLRFAYTSDPATNLENFYVDDVRILDAAGNLLFADDMETPGNWVPGGNPGFQWVTAEG